VYNADNMITPSCEFAEFAGPLKIFEWVLSKNKHHRVHSWVHPHLFGFFWFFKTISISFKFDIKSVNLNFEMDRHTLLSNFQHILQTF